MALIGLVYNTKGPLAAENEPYDLGAEYDSESTVNAVANAIRTWGYDVCLIEGDETAYIKLLTQRPDMVFNMSEGIRGESRESQIPAMLEMLGIPYTGSGPLSLALTLDKPAAKRILFFHGVPTAKFRVYEPGDVVPDLSGMSYPVFAKLAAEGSSMGITPSSRCDDEVSLVRELKRLSPYKRPVLVEEYLPGGEFTVGILGNEDPKIFPVMEICFDSVPKEHGSIYSRQFKTQWLDERYYRCPAPISKDFENLLVDTALRTYRALGCRDFARVDMRLDRRGIPNVMEINPLPGLSPEASDFPRMAAAAGWTYAEFIGGVLDCAFRRYGLGLTVPFARRPIA